MKNPDNEEFIMSPAEQAEFDKAREEWLYSRREALIDKYYDDADKKKLFEDRIAFVECSRQDD